MMQRQRHTPGKSCKTYEQQIKDLLDGSAGLNAYPELEKHSTGCPDCAAMIRLVKSLKDGLELDLNNQPAAPRSVLHNTLKYMEIRKSTSRKKENMFDSLSALLQYRIPVYQAIGGLVVLLFLSGFLWNSRSLTGNNGMHAFSDKTAMEDYYALDTLHANGTEKGQNAREDSILVGFLHYSL